jgi:hypothetical protein
MYARTDRNILVPYLTPVAKFIGDAIIPLTPACIPAILYMNLKQWGHPINRYRNVWWGGLMGSVMLAVSEAIKFGFDLYNVYRSRQGIEVEQICLLSECWKHWIEAGLLIFVIAAVAMKIPLDGGFFDRLHDHRAEQIRKVEEEKAAEANGTDFEKGDMEKMVPLA